VNIMNYLRGSRKLITDFFFEGALRIYFFFRLFAGVGMKRDPNKGRTLITAGEFLVQQLTPINWTRGGIRKMTPL
jgi:hypothetical protein